jgi:hypothetical protein
VKGKRLNIKSNSQRIVLRAGEHLEIYYSKVGYRKHYSSIAVGTADQEPLPEQQIDASTRLTWTIVGPAKLSLVISERQK